MQHSAIILSLIYLLASCQVKSTSKELQFHTKDTTTYPQATYICFNPQGNGKSTKSFKIGDSLPTVLKYIDLQVNTRKGSLVYTLKNPIVYKGELEVATISAEAKFNTFNRLIDFNVLWLYKGQYFPKCAYRFFSRYDKLFDGLSLGTKP